MDIQWQLGVGESLDLLDIVMIDEDDSSLCMYVCMYAHMYECMHVCII